MEGWRGLTVSHDVSKKTQNLGHLHIASSHNTPPPVPDMYYPCPPTSELVKSKIAQSIRVTSNIRKQHFPILVSSKPPQKDQSLSSACCPGGKTKKTKHFPIVRSRPLSTKPSFSFKGADEPTRETHSLFQRRRRTSRSKLTRFRLTLGNAKRTNYTTKKK